MRFGRSVHPPENTADVSKPASWSPLCQDAVDTAYTCIASPQQGYKIILALAEGAVKSDQLLPSSPPHPDCSSMWITQSPSSGLVIRLLAEFSTTVKSGRN